MNEIADLRKVDDVSVFPIHFPGGEAQDGAVQIDVVTSGEFGIKTRPQFQQRRNAPADVEGARRGLKNTGDKLQERTFSRAVLADDAESLTAPDIKRYIAESPEVPMIRAPVQGQQFFEAVARRRIDRITF